MSSTNTASSSITAIRLLWAWHCDGTPGALLCNEGWPTIFDAGTARNNSVRSTTCNASAAFGVCWMRPLPVSRTMPRLRLVGSDQLSRRHFFAQSGQAALDRTRMRFQALGTGKDHRGRPSFAQVFGSERKHRNDLEEVIDVDR